MGLPGSVAVQIGFVEDGTGVSDASVDFVLEDDFREGTSSGGGSAYGFVDYADSPQYTGTLTLEVTLPENAHPGAWRVSSVWLQDQRGNSTGFSLVYYDEGRFELSNNVTGSNLPAPGFSVKEVEPGRDYISPVIKSVRIADANTAKHAGETMTVIAEVVEEGSGIVSASCTLQLKDNSWNEGSSMGGTLADGYVDYEAPLKSGTFEIPVTLPENAKAGGWKLTSISVRDAAGNDGYAYIYGHGDEEYYNYFEIQGEEIVAPHFTVKDEFDFAFEMALSNPRLQEAIEGIDEGYAARILIDGDGVLSEGVLAAIAGKDVTLVCYKDAYQWVINGNDIVNEPKDIDLDVDIFQENGGRYGVDEDVVRLVFYPNGQLPGPIQLRFKSDYLYTFAGLEGSLHLYYLDNGKYVEEDGDIDLVFDGTDKWCYATFTHNSEFVVSPSELTTSDGAAGIKPLGTQGAGGSQLAATGDGAGIAAVAIGSIACVAGLTAWRVRRSATKR